MKQFAFFFLANSWWYSVGLDIVKSPLLDDTFFDFSVYWPDRLLDRDQADGEEPVEDEEEDEFLKGFKVLCMRSSF